MGRTTEQEKAYQASLKAIAGSRTNRPVTSSDRNYHIPDILGAGSIKKSTDTVAKAVANYEARDAEAQQKVLGAYQEGENALRTTAARTAGERQAGADQSLIGRGLYNTTLRDTTANQNAEVADASNLDIANSRANLLQTMRPNPQVYGPLLETIAANRVFTRNGTATEGIANEFDRRDAEGVDAIRGVYHGGEGSASSDLNKSVANTNAELATGLKGRGLAGTGVESALRRRGEERRQLGQANITGQTANVEQLARPDPGLYGPLIARLANKQVQPQTSVAGQLLPIAGGIAGGLVGGPGGAAVGGAIGGAIGGQVNRTGAAQGGVSGYGYGSAIGGAFGSGGVFANGLPSYNSGTATSQINSGPGGAYGDYPVSNYKGGGSFTIPTSSRRYT